MRGLGNDTLGSLSDLVGETVTIFTQSGGCSGQGFTGVILTINPCFVRLVNSFGSAPDNVFGINQSVRDRNCRNNRGSDDGGFCGCGGNRFHVGSVVDIPIDKIVAFAHNAV